LQRRKWTVLIAGLLALSLVGAACADDEGDTASPGGTGGEVSCETDEFGCVEIAAGEPINVGVAQVISGADATLGQDQVNAIELAADYLDGAFDGTDGTILDHPVTLTVEDDLCNAEGGQAAATAFAADTSIVGVIGTSCSSGALGVADTILSEKGTIIISGSNTNPALTSEEAHQPFYARTAHNDRIQGAIVAEFAYNEVGGDTAAVIVDESPYTQGLGAAFALNFEAAGGSVVAEEQINSLDTDFKPVLNAIAETDPDVLYAPVFVGACTLIMRQIEEIMPDAQMITSDGCFSSDVLKNAGDSATGVYASGPDLTAFQSNAFYGELVAAYEEAFGTAPISVFHAHSYDAFYVLKMAIEEVAIENDDGSLSIPRQALRDAVFATDGYAGVTGTITCGDLGDCATDVTIGVFQAPGWPVSGGSGDPPVYTDTKSLDDVA
jgi:branched-chain amino acid transport system substrate-binding protein